VSRFSAGAGCKDTELLGPPVPAGHAADDIWLTRRVSAPSVMSQMVDFVFDFELLPLKFGDPDVIRMRSGLFFGDQFIEVGMLGFECFDMFRCGHASTSFPGSEADHDDNANASLRRL
jgi:hypothetical protein